MLNENDPDKLQLIDELDTDWVKLWRRATNQKRATTKELNIQYRSPQKAIYRSSKLQFDKTQ